ncbi:FAD-binding dehydrogenase [Protaetiibacter intestinalis]|uniref:FAD-binding dehydrogenase n=1 Tax=Protaetiibacter intestinalis TaxID=2419774 RepID=A0A387BEY0_9MICO|nr:FAD-binding dehydrogenase [Protaetiibacter intestinalis]AYF97040.1 FAD-binding dehydrogenase [Protaetiibacter intestinalis]
MPEQADAIIIGAGLSGLVAAAELVEAGKRVIILDQEPEASFGGQAWWSFGGLFLIDSPEQRRMGVKDSHELARQDWFASAEFDRAEDDWAREWAEAYLAFAAGEKRDWLKAKGVSFFPVVGWAERGGYTATGHGNSVPRFHITWGTGPGILEPFIRIVREGVEAGLVELRFRHRVDRLLTKGQTVIGAAGAILAPDAAERGEASNREETGEFEVKAPAVVVASGGIGGNHELVRENWPEWLGTAPEHMLSGVPAHVDGRMLGIAAKAKARLVNGDRMWHYVEGIENHSPVWPLHGIRILPGPSSMWFDATGKRLPVPLFPGFDTLGTLEYLRQTGHDHSWFILDQSIIEKEFALSGSEQNPDLTGKSVKELLRQRLGKGATDAVEAFKEKGPDFVVADSLDDLFAGMRRLAPEVELDVVAIRQELEARDRELDNSFTKDAQVTAIRGARNYRGDKLIRVAKPHKILDEKHRPLIAVKLHVLTRKSLGGIQTDLSSRALNAAGKPIPGLYAVGEAAGFGGGGVHGYRALEGTFLGGCLFTGRQAGRAILESL